jgi:hypothetical protein
MIVHEFKHGGTLTKPLVVSAADCKKIDKAAVTIGRGINRSMSEAEIDTTDEKPKALQPGDGGHNVIPLEETDKQFPLWRKIIPQSKPQAQCVLNVESLIQALTVFKKLGINRMQLNVGDPISIKMIGDDNQTYAVLHNSRELHR